LTVPVEETGKPPGVADLREPYVVWHRGAGYLAPENGAAAFDLAAACGADLVELDARRLADGNWAVWHDADVDRLSTGRGAVESLSTAEFTALTVDASRWFGGTAADTRPLLLSEVLDRYGGRLRLLVHLNTPAGQASAIGPLLREIVDRKLRGSIMVQSWDRADLAACQAVGVPGMQLLISATLSAHEPGSLLADGIRRVSIRADEAGGVTDDEIRAYLRAGLSVQAHGIDRQYEQRRLAALGVGSFCTDEPVYLAGGDGYRRDTDPFATGTYGHGHLTNLLDAGTVDPSTRGAFTDPGWWSVPPGKQPLFALQGWACPLPEPARFTLHARVRVDRPAAAPSGWWGCHLAAAEDYRFSGARAQPRGSGYTVAVTGDGWLVVWARSPAGTEQLARVPVDPPSAGQSGRLGVDVTPSALTVQWSGASPARVTVRDDRVRGPYFYLGRSGDGPAVSFSGVEVVHGAPADQPGPAW
jgi:glycerophosphoryl diester phosphodiesterase